MTTDYSGRGPYSVRRLSSGYTVREEATSHEVLLSRPLPSGREFGCLGVLAAASTVAAVAWGAAASFPFIPLLLLSVWLANASTRGWFVGWHQVWPARRILGRTWKVGSSPLRVERLRLIHGVWPDGKGSDDSLVVLQPGGQGIRLLEVFNFGTSESRLSHGIFSRGSGAKNGRSVMPPGRLPVVPVRGVPEDQEISPSVLELAAVLQAQLGVPLEKSSVRLGHRPDETD